MKKFMSKHFNITFFIVLALGQLVAQTEFGSKLLKQNIKTKIDSLEDLDLITKIEVGSLSLKKSEFDVIELINEIFDLFEIKAQSNGIQLIFDKLYSKPILVRGDKEKIRQVATNLIVNSIKYGQNNGTTEVGIEYLNKDKIAVRITDNGIGIEKENLPRLFERFYRVDNTGSRDNGGSGLGLAIVKHIIEAHNQKIYIESEYGVGSEFSFTLEAVK